MKSFVKSYPDIIGYVDEEIASADSYGPEQRARDVEPWEAREPPGRGGAARSRNATYGQTSHRQRASCATTSTSDHGGRK